MYSIIYQTRIILKLGREHLINIWLTTGPPKTCEPSRCMHIDGLNIEAIV